MALSTDVNNSIQQLKDFGKEHIMTGIRVDKETYKLFLRYFFKDERNTQMEGLIKSKLVEKMRMYRKHELVSKANETTTDQQILEYIDKMIASDNDE
jgi:hypothetical protein